MFIYNVTLLSGSQSLEFMAQVVSVVMCIWCITGTETVGIIQATPISGIIFSIVIIRVGLNTNGELDWTVDHRTTINFAKKKTSGITKTDPALTTIRTTYEINVGNSSGQESSTDFEMSSGRITNEASSLKARAI